MADSKNSTGTKGVIYTSKIDTEDVYIRLADHEDYANMLAISEGVYSGYDYLPWKYHWFLDTEKAFMYLMFVAGRPIAFMMFIEIDDETLAMFSLRILPKYAGTGLYRILRNEVQEYITRQKAYKSLLSVGVLVPGRQKYLLKTGARNIYKWKWLMFDLDKPFDNELFKNTDYKTCSIPIFQVKELFQNEQNLKIFQSEIICVGDIWYPYRISLPHLLKLSQLHPVFITTGPEDTGTLKAISFVYKYFGIANKNKVFQICYFGSVDINIFSAHVLNVILAMREIYCVGKEEVQLDLHFPDGLTENDVTDFCTQLTSATLQLEHINIAESMFDRLVELHQKQESLK